MVDQDKTGGIDPAAESNKGAKYIPAPVPAAPPAPSAIPLITPVPQTDSGDASHAPEPHILEETVIRKPPPQKNEPDVLTSAVTLAATPVPPSPPPAKKTESPFAPPAQKSGDIGNDIANILKEVKLPERRDAPAAEKKPIENKAAVFDTTLGAVSAPAVQPPVAETRASAVPPPPATPSHGAPENPSSVVSVHTLKDDLQQVVHDEKISVVRAASLEEDKRARGGSKDFESPTEPPRSKRVFGILFAVGVLLVLGAGALFGVYTVMQGGSAPAPQTLSSSSVLFAESSVAFPLDGQTPDAIKRSLAGARLSIQGALGSVTAIIPTVAATNPDGTPGKRPATFAEFMNALGAHPPDSLLRALGTNFFFGIHTVDTNAPLLVIPVTSYDHAFAGMLAWESMINPDLAPVFTAVPTTAQDANGLPVDRTFTDNVRQNYDVRELKDDSGQVRLYYSFPTQNILVIAESPYSFAEILSRLQAQREL